MKRLSKGKSFRDRVRNRLGKQQRNLFGASYTIFIRENLNWALWDRVYPASESTEKIQLPREIQEELALT